MPFSHHSHSGEFCGHAKDKLEAVVQKAIARHMEVLCMTEHMPRDHEEDLYPEELAENITPSKLSETFEAYIKEARHLQKKYGDQIRILVGMETDWIRPVTCNVTIQRLLSTYEFDMFVGSVHHVHSIPIDFSQELFDKAAAASAEKAGIAIEGAERALAADYFDLQHDMLTTLKPPVVGHFDLIRLLARFEQRGDGLRQWPDVWDKVKRNLEVVKQYGGCLEINSAGLRKGLREPYPCSDICKEFLSLGGSFVLSDDSHGVAQVATCFKATLDYIQSTGLPELVAFKAVDAPDDSRFRASASERRAVESLWQTKFARSLD